MRGRGIHFIYTRPQTNVVAALITDNYNINMYYAVYTRLDVYVTLSSNIIDNQQMFITLLKTGTDPDQN